MRTETKKNHLKEFATILLGAFFIASALEGFLLVNNLAFGGFGGLSLIIETVFGLPDSRRVIFWGMSLTMLSVAGHRKGEVFLYKSFCAFSMIAFGFPTILIWLRTTFDVNIFDVFSGLPLWMAAIMGGIVLGMGAVFILSVGGSASGPDTLALTLLSPVRHLFKIKHQQLSDRVLMPIIMICFDLGVYIWGLVVFGLDIWEGVFAIITIPLIITIFRKKG